ncbi:MAG TPA: cupin domain-containing protein [Oculatellaceae cyanobacterium]
MTADDLIEQLNLVPHPEGGFYRETYRSSVSLMQSDLPPVYTGARSASTCIYYLLVGDRFSCMHRICTDEIFHFYAGDSVEMLQLFSEPVLTSRRITIGNRLELGESPQYVVPANSWQGFRLKPISNSAGVAGFALLGCTVAPGFDFADYEEGLCSELSNQFPEEADLIVALTRQ